MKLVAKRPTGPGVLPVLLAAVLLSAPLVAWAEPDQDFSASTTAQSPLEIEAMELRPADSGSQLEVATSGPMIWTSYRDGDGNLVIELPNSLPSARVALLDLHNDLVESTQVEVQDTGERPVTRLVVRTRGDAEHSVAAEGSRLLVDLTPIGQPGVAEVPAVFATTEPAPAFEPGDTVTSVVAEAAFPEMDTMSSPDTMPEAAEDKPQMGPNPSGVPATQLRNVKVTTGQEETTVWIEGDGSFYYSTFSLESPHRFVVDLIGVVNTSPLANLSVAAPVVDGVRVAQFKPQPELVSRVVIDLVESAVPEILASDDGLKLVFGDAAPSALNMGAPIVSEDVTEPAYAEESGVDPEPVADTTASEWTEVVAEPGGDEMPAAQEWAETEEMAPEPAWEEPAPEDVMAAVEEPVYEEPVYEEPVYQEPLPEPVEVAQATPPVYEEPAPAMAELPAPAPAASDSSLFRVGQVDIDNETSTGPDFSARDVTEDGESTYEGEPITMSLNEADIKDVLRSFAQISGLNIVIQPGVEGIVNVELTDVPWDQALDIILKINGLGYQLEGSIMRIATQADLEKEAAAQQKIEEAKALSVPLRTVMQRVSYAVAGDIAGVLTSGRAGLLSQRGSVVTDQRTNTLIIKELPTNLNTVLAVVETLDIPEPQVMIEARIIETTKRFSRTLGIAWSFDGIADAAHGNTTGLTFPNNAAVDGQVNLLSGGSNGFLGVSLGNVLNTFNLDATLQAAENEGLINVLSAPKIATLNNNKASIQSGLQIPIQTVANNTVSVQFVNATLRLDVTPHVTAEGTVLMDIEIQKREPQLAFAVVGATNAPIATRDASTRVIVRDGGTAVIGGIYEVSSDQGEDRVPGLSNVPLLKHLFKNKRRTDENEELLIFITPRIVRL